MDAARRMISGVEFTDDAYSCVEGCDAVVLATEWAEFATLNFAHLFERMQGNIFVDLRNAIPTEKLIEAGFAPHRIGGGKKVPLKQFKLVPFHGSGKASRIDLLNSAPLGTTTTTRSASVGES